MKKRIVSVFLVVVMVMSVTLTANATVSTSDIDSKDIKIEIVEELNAMYLRYEEDGKYITEVRDLDGNLQGIVSVENGEIYLDGEKVGAFKLESNITQTLLTDDNGAGGIYLPNAVKWGSWGAWSTLLDVDTGGKKAAVILALITPRIPWVPLEMVTSAASVIAASYDNVKIKCRLRYGTDSTYSYYERQTKIYGDNVLVLGPYTDTGKTPLNGSGAKSI